MRRFAIVLVGGCWTASPATQPVEPVVTEAPSPKVSVAPTERWDQSTPRQALYAFVRAVEQERYDIVMRFVPSAYRDKLTEDKLREQFALEATKELFAKLRTDLDRPISEQGDDARMPYGDRFEVRLVREDGVWRIKDLD